jgi:predicted Zn-dependent peptidase
MRARLRTLGVALACGACGAGALAAARSPALSPSLSAAWRAFRDPSLLDPKPAPAAVSCARLADDERAIAADLARHLDRPLPDDLDDPEGATLRSLTLPDLRVPITRRTMRFVRFLTKTDAGRAAFLQRHRRAALYRERIAFALGEAGLPEDLLWLAAVESGFDPRAVSPAGAAGLWQLMPETAQLYGLEQSPFVDERRSIARATHAAVTHLRDLYERFGRWDLALAAYNAGYDRVASAVEKLTGGHGPDRLDAMPVTFAELAEARALPEETIQYVPQIIAFALVAANRTRFGLDGPELGAPLELGEIAVPEGTRLRTIARAAGISIAVLRDYNPQLLRDRVPPIGGDYLVTVPEGRVQRTLASFPSFSDQEVLDRADADPAATSDDAPEPLTRAAGTDPDADEPLPKRPTPLGRNRLPELAPPRRAQRMFALGASGPNAPAWAAAFGVGFFEAKLPAALAMPDVGWQHAVSTNGTSPLDLLAGGAHEGGYRMQALGPERLREASIEAELGFLRAPASADALKSFALPNGITVRIRRDQAAPTTAITVRVASVEDPPEGPLTARKLARRGAEVGAAEALHTITVERADSDAGIELAATRLRLLLGDTTRSELAEIRFHAGRARRKHLLETPYGTSWLALGDALFPPDHALAGTVLGATDDEAALCDLTIAEAMGREHAHARGSLTVVGDVDETHARNLAEAFLAAAHARGDEAVEPHPREDRLSVEDEVALPHALVGWIGPPEGAVGDASLRVAFEIFDGQKTTLLRHALVDEKRVASIAHAGLESWPRASIATIEVAPAPERDVGTVLAALDKELARLADEGPSANDVAIAKWFLFARLQKAEARAAATAKPAPGPVRSAGVERIRHALRPWAAERAAKALDEVTPATVRAAVRRILAPDHRVVVFTVPKTR